MKEWIKEAKRKFEAGNPDDAANSVLDLIEEIETLEEQNGSAIPITDEAAFVADLRALTAGQLGAVTYGATMGEIIAVLSLRAMSAVDPALAKELSEKLPALAPGDLTKSVQAATQQALQTAVAMQRQREKLRSIGGGLMHRCRIEGDQILPPAEKE